MDAFSEIKAVVFTFDILVLSFINTWQLTDYLIIINRCLLIFDKTGSFDLDTLDFQIHCTTFIVYIFVRWNVIINLL